MKAESSSLPLQPSNTLTPAETMLGRAAFLHKVRHCHPPFAAQSKIWIPPTEINGSKDCSYSTGDRRSGVILPQDLQMQLVWGVVGKTLNVCGSPAQGAGNQPKFP